MQVKRMHTHTYFKLGKPRIRNKGLPNPLGAPRSRRLIS
jgi:hypothetical protein